jgi:glycosyltransferase involved in cell wall biosynthesis
MQKPGLTMASKQLSVVYISPRFPYPRHGFELVELEELDAMVDLHIVSLRNTGRESWEWMTNRIHLDPERNYSALNAATVIRGLPWLLQSVLAGTPCSKMLTRAFIRDVKGGLKTAIALMGGSYVAKIAQKVGANVIHADFASAPATVAMAASELTGIPFSFCGHAFDIFSSKPGGKATKLLIREKATKAFAMFAENTKVVSQLSAMTKAPDKIHLKRNGIRGSICPPSENRSGPFRIVGLGGLVAKKGFDLLVQAAAALAKRGECVEVAIYGEGPERGALERLAKEEGISLQLPGAYRHSEVETILAQAAVMVLPSRVLSDNDSDGVPTVFLEALRCGVPIIGADVGSVRDIIRDGETGWLVRSDDVDDLARALTECLNDYTHACHLCRQGQELLVVEFRASESAAAMVQKWSELTRVR